MDKFIKLFLLTISVIWTLSGCSSSDYSIQLAEGLLDDTSPDANYVWVGKGEAFVYQNNQWLRKASDDYDFSVVQRRYQEQWVSVKNQLRRHPDYDESAGARTQTHLFTINYKNSDEVREFDLISTFGNGTGTIDAAYQQGVMEFAANVSKWAPYSHFRISQQYNYQQKQLTETVLLFKKHEDGSETPFAKIEETASLAQIKS